MLTRRQGGMYTPFEQLNRLGEEMERLFGNGWTEPYEGAGVWMPPMDVQETVEDIRCILEVPGINKDDLEITVNGNVLTIAGEKKATEEENTRVFRSERRFGRFSRSITLPTGVDANSVKATYSDGILSLVLPKTPEAKPRRIQITADQPGHRIGTGE